MTYVPALNPLQNRFGAGRCCDHARSWGAHPASYWLGKGAGMWRFRTSAAMLPFPNTPSWCGQVFYLLTFTGKVLIAKTRRTTILARNVPVNPLLVRRQDFQIHVSETKDFNKWSVHTHFCINCFKYKLLVNKDIFRTWQETRSPLKIQADCCLLFRIIKNTQNIANKVTELLGAFPKLQKATTGFLISLCLRPSVLPHWTIRFTQDWFSWNLTFEYLSKIIRENTIWYNETGHRWQYNTAHALCMLDNKAYRHTLIVCSAYCCSTATMVTRTRLSVALISTSPVFLMLQSALCCWGIGLCCPTC
jgi:hypothetical protein